MLYVCVRHAIDVVFLFASVPRGDVCARVWEVCVSHHTYVVWLRSCVHPVAVLSAAFCMTCNLLMLVENARGNHMEEAFSRTGML